jgi:hypothetical protein
VWPLSESLLNESLFELALDIPTTAVVEEKVGNSFTNFFNNLVVELFLKEVGKHVKLVVYLGLF